jgi:hypothetical protein
MSNVELEQSPAPEPGFLQFHPDIYKHITSGLLKQDTSFVMFICLYFATTFELHATNGEVTVLLNETVRCCLRLVGDLGASTVKQPDPTSRVNAIMAALSLRKHVDREIRAPPPVLVAQCKRTDGRSSSNNTLRVYLHALPQAFQVVADRLKEVRICLSKYRQWLKVSGLRALWIRYIAALFATVAPVNYNKQPGA